MTEATPNKSSAAARGRSGFGLGGAVVALCFVILVAQTWRKWGDMLVDFGVQLYVPWKLSTGAVLYHDIAYLTAGPLSQYYHAWLFRIFGVSLLTIVISNLLILFLLVAAIYTGVYRNSDTWTATMAGLALVLVFAFEHYTPYGTFNYVSPYSHEVVHGLVLSVVVLWLLSRWLSKENISMALLAGIGVGMVLLTKPEVFLALAVTVAAALALFWQRKHRAAALAGPVLAMLGGAVLPPAAFFLYFIQHDNFAQSLRFVLWAWTAVLTHAAPNNNLYRWCLGLDKPGYHIRMILLETAGLAAILGIYVTLFRMKWSGTSRKILFALAVIAIGYLSRAFEWFKCGYCLPALCLTSVGLFLGQARQKGFKDIPSLPFLWSIFSLMLLAKLGLFPRVWHYGFVLAMPAFLTAIYLLLWQLPPIFEKPGVPAEYFRAIVSVGLLIGFAQLWQDSQNYYGERTALVGHGADQMLTFKAGSHPSSATLGQVADWIEANTPANSTLAVLPDGSMLNYLTRRNNPTGYLRWNPTEMTLFGQDNMSRAFMTSPPDYIILIQFDVEGFKIKAFGQDKDFGLELKQWIDAHYKPVYQTGPPAITVYRRGPALGVSGTGHPKICPAAANRARSLSPLIFCSGTFSSSANPAAMAADWPRTMKTGSIRIEP
jgi:hypothetical protein